MKILIVDDDPGTRNSLKAGLTSFGYQVLAAADAPEALKIIESSINSVEPVEIMVTDLKMPGMNGLELIRSAKKMRSGLAAILMTAYGDDHIREEVTNLGRCGYIYKPFGPGTLLNMIKETVAVHKS
ncbi:MAG: response regulator [Desulfobacteraceae bacterium]|nr:response regulator [Desulfobacteraceae bacterium]